MAWTTRPELRIRVTTVFLILAFINLMIERGYVATPAWMWQDPVQPYAHFYIFDFTSMAIAISALINLIALPLNLWKKRWRASGQAGLEILLCVVCKVLLPDYD